MYALADVLDEQTQDLLEASVVIQEALSIF
jgi:hypothetical protein